jgi:hypothetical protein
MSVYCRCFVLSGRRLSVCSLVQRSPTECGVSGCNREASIIKRSWPTRAVLPWQRQSCTVPCNAVQRLGYWLADRGIQSSQNTILYNASKPASASNLGLQSPKLRMACGLHCHSFTVTCKTRIKRFLLIFTIQEYLANGSFNNREFQYLGISICIQVCQSLYFVVLVPGLLLCVSRIKVGGFPTKSHTW